jgi:RNase adaptor protein for sRNA GlmZ degradation
MNNALTTHLGSLSQSESDSDCCRGITVEIESFGHKHGPVPDDADLLFDVREAIPNPYRLPGMRWLTGFDEPVFNHVCEVGRTFIETLLAEVRELVEGLLRANKCGKIAVGCKGGRQRSVALVRLVVDYINRAYHGQVQLLVHHRDMARDLALEPGRSA